MSYYATVNGSIEFKEPATKEKLMQVRNYLSEKDIAGDAEVREDGIEFYGCYHYYDEDKFNDLIKVADIKAAVLNFVGEDDSRWQFVFKPDGDSEGGGFWHENVCDNIYRSITAPDYNKLKALFISYVTADAEESGDPGYITRKLEQCGCHQTFRNELGLDFPEQEG